MPQDPYVVLKHLCCHGVTTITVPTGDDVEAQRGEEMY